MKHKTIKHVLSSLQKTPKILKEFMASIDADALDRKRGPEVWTLREHLYHLANVQPMLCQRLEIFRDQDPVEIVPYHPSREQGQADHDVNSVQDALKQFKAWRKKQVKMVKTFKQSIFEKKAIHNQYTRYDLGILLRHILMHDYWHMYRMEDIWICKEEFFDASPQ